MILRRPNLRMAKERENKVYVYWNTDILENNSVRK